MAVLKDVPAASWKVELAFLARSRMVVRENKDKQFYAQSTNTISNILQSYITTTPITTSQPFITSAPILNNHNPNHSKPQTQPYFTSMLTSHKVTPTFKYYYSQRDLDHV
jgi:hypothetical protein